MHAAVQTDRKLKDALNTAIVLRSEGRYTEALRYMENVRPFFEDDPVQLRRFLSGLGVTHRLLGNAEQAVREYQEALRIPARTVEEELEVAAIQGNIANALVDLDRASEAHAVLDLAEQVFRKAGMDSWLADRLETRARAYLKQGNYERAKDAAKEALDLHWNGFEMDAISQSLKTLSVCFEAYEKSIRRGGLVSALQIAGGQPMKDCRGESFCVCRDDWRAGYRPHRSRSKRVESHSTN